MTDANKDLLVAHLLISLGGATRIMNFSGKKAHRNKGWYFSLEDIGMSLRSVHLISLAGLQVYSDYSSSNEPAYILKVYQPKKQMAQQVINKEDGYFWLGV